MNDHMEKRPDGNKPDRNEPGKPGHNKNRQSLLAFLLCLLVTLPELYHRNPQWRHQ